VTPFDSSSEAEGEACDAKALFGGIREFRTVQNQLNSAPLPLSVSFLQINSDEIMYNHQALHEGLKELLAAH
jgi:hypothetical protein